MMYISSKSILRDESTQAQTATGNPNDDVSESMLQGGIRLSRSSLILLTSRPSLRRSRQARHHNSCSYLIPI